MVSIMRCSWQMRLIIDFFLIPWGRGFLARDGHIHLFFQSLYLHCDWIFESLLQIVDILHHVSHVSVPGILRYVITVWKSTNARILQIILLLTNLSKSCINDHKLKWAAKEVTSWSQFFQRKNKRIEDQKLNGLKRILILNTSKFTNRGLFNFRFLPLTGKKFKTYFHNENWFFLSLKPTHLLMKK